MARLKSRPFKAPPFSTSSEARHALRFEAHSGSTSIFIGPGHRFRVVGGLLTNFHLPESTLLMLVSAFAGREKWCWLRMRMRCGRGTGFIRMGIACWWCEAS